MDDELFESWKAGIEEAFIQEIRRARHMLETAIDNIMKMR